MQWLFWRIVVLQGVECASGDAGGRSSGAARELHGVARPLVAGVRPARVRRRHAQSAHCCLFLLGPVPVNQAQLAVSSRQSTRITASSSVPQRNSIPEARVRR